MDTPAIGTGPHGSCGPARAGAAPSVSPEKLSRLPSAITWLAQSRIAAAAKNLNCGKAALVAMSASNQPLRSRSPKGETSPALIMRFATQHCGVSAARKGKTPLDGKLVLRTYCACAPVEYFNHGEKPLGARSRPPSKPTICCSARVGNWHI